MPRVSPLARLIANAGAVAFLASILFLTFCYGRSYGVTAPSHTMTPFAPIAIDVALFSAFALHHSLFARTGLKAWIERLVTPPLERSTYVWVASVLFIITCALWQPVPGVAWACEGPIRYGMYGLQIAGGVITFRAVRRLDVLDLAGVRQIMGAQISPRHIARTGLYGWVRHPIYFGWFLVMWPAPLMTGTRLTFAAISSLYLIVAVPWEERGLRKTFGTEYDTYIAHVRWRILPFIW